MTDATSQDERLNIHCVVCGERFARTVQQWERSRTLDDPDRWRCDECVSTGRHLRWPLTGVDSSSFSSAPHVVRLHAMAVGFLQSARVLCEALGGSQTISWPRASVVYSTSNHAMELFLKACIIAVSPNENIGHHDVDRLRLRFAELHPSLGPLPITWESRMSGIPTDQLFRYGADRNGASLGDDELVFAPAKWIQWIEQVEVDFQRIWSAIMPASS